jgi:hypothetical protein
LDDGIDQYLRIGRIHKHEQLDATKPSQHDAGPRSEACVVSVVPSFICDLARELAQVVSEPIFDIARLVEASRDERFDSILRCGSSE